LVIGRSFLDAAPGARLGDARLGAFHDAVLELGSVPLPVVTARVGTVNAA
jgi:uncharacterized protein (DUF885 family)